MEIIVGKNAGFCFGVRNAVDKTTEVLKRKGKAYCLGELVHNRQVVEKLERQGLRTIERLDQIQKETVIVRAHGIPTQVYQQAKERQIELEDFTCPKVQAIHRIAEEKAKQNNYLFLIGDKKHPETVGSISFGGKNSCVIENLEQVKQAMEQWESSKCEKLVVLSQTTIKVSDFEEIINTIQQQVEESRLEIYRTICLSTQERQKETMQIAKQVDSMIIIGGKNSSNTKQLYEVAKEYCPMVIKIETEKELENTMLEGKKKIGIMAGASTSQQSIQQVIETLKQMEESNDSTNN